MSDEESKMHATIVLESMGYVVVPIPVSPVEERADLMATYGSEVLILEAKGKEPHEAFHKMHGEADSRGVAKLSRKVVPWSALSSVIKKAVGQLEASPAPETAPRILLISCLHDDWSYVLDAFRFRLYGEVELQLWRRDVFTGSRPCFYYEFSEFRRYPLLDGVILAGPEGVLLLINEFGDRKRYLRQSKLYAEALKAMALCDPEDKRAAGKALAVLAPVVLQQEDRWQYLLDNYGYMTNVMNSYDCKGLAAIPVQ